MKTYFIELTGNTPILQNKMSEDVLLGLLFKSKEKKKVIKNYETPREIAEKVVYKNINNHYYIPDTWIIMAFNYIATDYKQQSSRKSLSSISCGVFRIIENEIILIDPSTNLPISNFEVDIARGNNRNAGKSIAVALCRPRFDNWRVRFHAQIAEDLLSPEMAQQILEDAGRRAGFGSWRVSCKGSFGMFSVSVFKEINDLEIDLRNKK